MTIYKDDIKLFESKVMNDEPDGGGAMTGIEIISGEHNNMFDDISDLDRAYGDVGIRSVHLKVDAPTDETYFGVTVGLIDKPADSNVEITLMSVNDPYIERDETKDIIERYLTSGVKYQGELFYDQVVGQRAVRLIQYTHISPPASGEVLIVRNKVNGFEQYVKIIKSSYESQSFVDTKGSFTLRVVTCEISEPLRETLTGVTPNRYMSTSSQSEVSEAMIADASKYYGMKLLKNDALFNTSLLEVNGTYNQLVPSARIDNAHINVPIVDIANAPVAINSSGTETTELPINLESQSFPIDIDNQGYVFVQTLLPYPTKNTLQVHYISQGNWYTLYEDGNGVLKGVDESHGTGTLDEFGNVSITTGALPDITSEIIFQWGSTSIHTELLQDSDLSLDSEIKATATTYPNSDDMTFTWDDKTAHCTGGIITGDATGYVNATAIEFRPLELPTAGATIATSWTANAGGVIPSHSEDTTIQMVDNGTQYTFNRGDTSRATLYLDVTPADYNADGGRANYSEQIQTQTLVFSDTQVFAKVNGYSVLVGALNPTTGAVVIEKNLLNFSFVEQTWEKKSSHWWKSKNWTVTRRERVTVNCVASTIEVDVTRYFDSVISPPLEAGTFNFTADTIEIQFEHRGIDVLADTVRINLNGKAYTIEGGVVLDNGVNVGEFNEVSNTITLNTWATGSDALTASTGLYQYNVKQYVQDMVFITESNPVASRSLQINAIDVDGNHVTGVADANGNIAGGGFEGTIDLELGIVLLSNDNPVESVDIKYNCVSYNYLPLDAELLGLDPIRLPSDGRVVIYQKGDVIVVSQDEELTVTVAANHLLDLGEVRLESCETTATDAIIDLDSGKIVFPTAGTYDIKYRFEDMALLTYVDISGALKTSRPLSHNYTAGKAKVASLLIAGDLFARYTNLFDQKTWTGVFSDNLIGDEAPVAYNDTLYPITVTDDGAITERLAIVFTSSTAFKLIGENIGQIAVGTVNADFAPINPISGKPYFTLDLRGWGAGWATNNVLRLNTIGATYQMNVIRTILQGESENPIDSDKFALQFRGNVNKENV